MAKAPLPVSGQLPPEAFRSLPLKVYVEDPALMHSALQAIELWNHASGRELMRIVSDPSGAQVTVHSARWKKGDELARADMGGANVWIPPDYIKTYGKENAVSVIGHELGHTLGLDHPKPAPREDTIASGLMGGDTANAPIPQEVANALRALGITPSTVDQTGITDVGRKRESAVHDLPTFGPDAPFAWYQQAATNPDYIKYLKDHGFEVGNNWNFAAQLVMTSLVNAYKTETPDGQIEWGPGAKDYSISDYIQDVSKLATHLPGTRGLAESSASGAPGGGGLVHYQDEGPAKGTPAATRRRNLA